MNLYYFLVPLIVTCLSTVNGYRSLRKSTDGDRKLNRQTPKIHKMNPNENTCSSFECLAPLYKWSIKGTFDHWMIGGDTKLSIEAKHGPIAKWDVSRVTSMVELFATEMSCPGGSHEVDVIYFDEDISQWDVSQVTNMYGMFRGSSFNGDISGWDISRVTNMSNMFIQSLYNSDLTEWDVSRVIDMYYMFSESTFNQKLCWDVSDVQTTRMFHDSVGCIKKSCCLNCDSDLLCN